MSLSRTLYFTLGMICVVIGMVGAFVPLLVGAISDATSYTFAFVIPAICYALLCAFAMSAGRTAPMREAEGKSAH